MAKDDEEKEATEAKGGGKKKLIIMVVPVLLLLAGAGWWFFLKPDSSDGPVVLPEPAPGAVVKLDPITVNLAAGHFLKFGLALQPIAAAHELDGAKALDLAISEFSQMTVDELSTAEGRNKAKEELLARIKLTYLPEGTDVADATSTASPSEKKAAAAKKEKETEAQKEKEKIHIEELSAAEVIKMADHLTVQPEVYEIYFTEFVMQ
jgi:flagellar protein FliL